MNHKLLSIVASVGIATGFVITGGCSEPKGPPPGATSESAPANIEFNSPPSEATPPAQPESAPPTTPAESNPPADQPGEK